MLDLCEEMGTGLHDRKNNLVYSFPCTLLPMPSQVVLSSACPSLLLFSPHSLPFLCFFVRASCMQSDLKMALSGSSCPLSSIGARLAHCSPFNIFPSIIHVFVFRPAAPQQPSKEAEGRAISRYIALTLAMSTKDNTASHTRMRGELNTLKTAILTHLLRAQLEKYSKD